jgi:hypothetical protein
VLQAKLALPSYYTWFKRSFVLCLIQFLYLAGMIRSQEQGKDSEFDMLIESIGIKILIVFFSYFGIASY